MDSLNHGNQADVIEAFNSTSKSIFLYSTVVQGDKFV